MPTPKKVFPSHLIACQQLRLCNRSGSTVFVSGIGILHLPLCCRTDRIFDMGLPNTGQNNDVAVIYEVYQISLQAAQERLLIKGDSATQACTVYINW